jgi:hypothetical protein
MAESKRLVVNRESLEIVRARQELQTYEEWWQRRINDSSPLNVKVSANLMLNKVTYSPGEKSDAAIDQSVCIPVRTRTGASLDAALLPAKSK